MTEMIEDFLGAIAFLSVLGGSHSPRPASRYWFAPTGAIIGLVAGVIWVLLRDVKSPLVLGALVVAVVVGITGAIHLDGLADAADGLLAHLSTEKRFEVMSGPEVGAFGIVSLIMVLLLQTAALGALRPNILLLAGIFALSRGITALVVEVVPYAKPSGLVSNFKPGGRIRLRSMAVLVGACIAACIIVIDAVGLRGVLLCVVVGLVQLGITWRSNSLLGGYTGDVLGASIVASETLALVFGVLVQR